MIFKVGDVVQLKSGGAAMTVEGVELDKRGGKMTRVVCVWFREAMLDRGIFADPEVLRPIDAKLEAPIAPTPIAMPVPDDGM